MSGQCCPPKRGFGKRVLKNSAAAAASCSGVVENPAVPDPNAAASPSSKSKPPEAEPDPDLEAPPLVLNAEVLDAEPGVILRPDRSAHAAAVRKVLAQLFPANCDAGICGRIADAALKVWPEIIPVMLTRELANAYEPGNQRGPGLFLETLPRRLTMLRAGTPLPPAFEGKYEQRDRLMWEQFARLHQNDGRIHPKEEVPVDVRTGATVTERGLLRVIRAHLPDAGDDIANALTDAVFAKHGSLYPRLCEIERATTRAIAELSAEAPDAAALTTKVLELFPAVEAEMNPQCAATPRTRAEANVGEKRKAELLAKRAPALARMGATSAAAARPDLRAMQAARSVQ
jgi:hypothetical protein